MDLATAKVGMPMPKMTIAHRCQKNKEYLDLLLVLAWDYFSFHLPHCKYIGPIILYYRYIQRTHYTYTLYRLIECILKFKSSEFVFVKACSEQL